MSVLSAAQKTIDGVLVAVDKAVELRWDHALKVARSSSDPPALRVAAETERFAREMAAVGAAAGATAVAPGLGTIAELGTTAAEIGVFTARAADLILTVAAIHGHTIATVEERKAWVLSVLAFGDTASVGFAEAANALRKGLGKSGTPKTTNKHLGLLNRTLGRAILKRYGARQGAAAVGRALPLGIGAVVGGSANYAFAKAIGKHADKFFRDLPLEVASR